MGFRQWRNIDTYQSRYKGPKDLWNTGLIDDLIIGNMFASEQELQALGQLNRHKLELQVQ